MLYLIVELSGRLALLVRHPVGPELYLALGLYPVALEGLDAVGVGRTDRHPGEGGQGDVDVLVGGPGGLVHVLADALPSLKED